MRNIIAFAVLIVGISAIPNVQFPFFNGQKIDFTNERIVTNAIESAITAVSEGIVAAGLDPYSLESNSVNVALPVPVLFSLDAITENVSSTGLSNISINNLNYSLITNRLTFDISLPLISLIIGNSEVDAVFFGKSYTSSFSGGIAISNIRLAGNVRVSIGVLTGVSLRSLAMNFSLGGIESAFNLVIQDRDFSDSLNTFLGTTIPTTLEAYSAEINELIEYYATIIIEANL